MNGNLSLEQRYLAVVARIRRAAEASGRDPSDVRLLAVSKTFPAKEVAALAGAGQLDFGENYLQEALGKIAVLGQWQDRARVDERSPSSADRAPGLQRQESSFVSPVPPDLPLALPTALLSGGAQPAQRIRWHFIGPIQSNKTRKIAEVFDWVQSVENVRIAERLSAQRPIHLPSLDVCVQVNVSGEASKSGCEPDLLVEISREVAQLPRLRLRGVMAIPEPTKDVTLQVRRFAQVRVLFEELRGAVANTGSAGALVDTLSMGMSADLEAAIAQGATLVRIGSALFGERPRQVKAPLPDAG